MRRLTPLAVGSLRRDERGYWAASLATADGTTRLLFTSRRERALAALGEVLSQQPPEVQP